MNGLLSLEIVDGSGAWIRLAKAFPVQKSCGFEKTEFSLFERALIMAGYRATIIRIPCGTLQQEGIPEL
jgi:hypothetical protein